MSALKADAEIKRILRASNHFDLLKLAKPHADLMDQPVWELTGDDVHRAFRKLSLCCHPDKSKHPDAPRAFEALKAAKKCLSEPLERDDYLLDFLKRQKTSWEGNWAGADSASDARQRVSSMREEAQRTEADQVVDAMRERRERAEAAARKKARVQAAQQRRATDREAAPADDDDDDDDEAPTFGAGGGGAGRAAASTGARAGGGAVPRKRPKFL
jgi:curved DNA-binding protein CbpA